MGGDYEGVNPESEDLWMSFGRVGPSKCGKDTRLGDGSQQKNKPLLDPARPRLPSTLAGLRNPFDSEQYAPRLR